MQRLLAAKRDLHLPQELAKLHRYACLVLDDIGYVPRGSRLNLDWFGRIAVIHDGVYAVLNDTSWINLAPADESTRTPMTDVVQAGDGRR